MPLILITHRQAGTLFYASGPKRNKKKTHIMFNSTQPLWSNEFLLPTPTQKNFSLTGNVVIE